MIHRRDQLRGKNEVGYQQECQADPSAETEGLQEGQPDTSVDPDTSSIPRGWSCFYHIFQHLFGVMRA